MDAPTGMGPKCGNLCTPCAGHQRTLTAGEMLDKDMDRMTRLADVRQSPASVPPPRTCAMDS